MEVPALTRRRAIGRRAAAAAIVSLALAGCADKPVFETVPASIRLWDDGRVFWMGAFKRVDYQKYLDRGLPPEALKELSIRNSPGGELSVVTKLRVIVAEHDVPVRIQGQCASGCAMIYVATARHAMLDDLGDRRTYLHFHGTYNPQTGVVYERFDERELAVLARTTRGRFPAALYRQARLVEHPRGGLYVYKYTYDGEDGGPSVFLCTGHETSIPTRCKVLPMTAVGLGLDD